LGIEANPVDVRDPGNIERAITAFARLSSGGLVVTASPLATVHRELIFALAARFKLPAVYSERFWVSGGGLMARTLAKTNAFEQSCRDRKRIEMLFAHLKRILRLGRLRLRGPRGAQFEFTLAAVAQNLRRLSKLVARPPPAAVACAA
jgi:hypothetical protein